MSLTYLLNWSWMLKCAGQRTAFHRAVQRVELEQAEVLRAILTANRNTEFGQTHHFNAIGSPRRFRELVPPSNYDDYRQPIARIAAGHTGVLTAERVRLFEPTTGSAGPEKLIPYTDGLRRQFQRGLSVWIGDLLKNRPALRGGRAYWSISPMFGPTRRTSGGVKIGFEDDAAYLGSWEQWALRWLLVAPTGLSQINEIENFRYCTLLYLLVAGDLRLISIWNPTFLSLLLAALPCWSDQICRDLRQGAVTLPKAVPGQQRLELSLRPNRQRADELADIFRFGGELSEKLRHIWKRLTLVSCWADAAAALPLGELSRLFPDVEVQPKGLLATEGIISIPLLDCAAPALALRSHFFEFIEAADNASSQALSRVRLAHELEQGGKYRIMLTTAGGLYRYQLGDEVEITGFVGQCPLLKFLGRGDHVCDLVGEKLSDAYVRAVVDRAIANLGVRVRFALLAPADDEPARYRLYLQTATSNNVTPSRDAFQRIVESGLAANPHYRYAVALGQLAPVEICLLDPAGPPASEIYERGCVARGQKVGNVKPVALSAGPGWQSAFRSLEIPLRSRHPPILLADGRSAKE